MKSIKTLSNDQLVSKYQEVRHALVLAEVGTPEEAELDNLFMELSKELSNRDIDLRPYKAK